MVSSRCLIALLGFGLFAQTAPQAWVVKSNQNARLLLDLSAKYGPEGASSQGDLAFDEKISQPTEQNSAKAKADMAAARKELQSRLAAETDPLVKQDLEILIADVDRDIRSQEVNEKTFLPYMNVAGLIFAGEKTLLDEQTGAARRPAAVVRLRRYTGMEPGYTPITKLAMERYREKAKNPALLGPAKEQVEKNLENTSTLVTGLGILLEKYKLQGYSEAYAKLREQLAEYDEFVRKEVMPRARTDFRLPPAIYQTALDNYGVDYTSADLAKLAHEGFVDIQKQMAEIAVRVAKARNLPSSDYRSVIRALKKEQFAADEILPKYEATLKAIEEIVRKNKLLTLPERPARIVIASAAETAQQPAPHMQPPPLMNNRGERGSFVLPLATKGAHGVELKYDDFTFAAAAWTLTAHEARPGHELQFASMVERGVSLARAMFAFNSTNVEGWGLYSEWFMLPYMPDEGKLISLQLRMLRAARAFLDPELQSGKVTPEQAMRVLEEDVVCSRAFATEEVERFTFRMPGQAVSYYDGYSRLLELRLEVEKALGPKFDAGKFHDFILSQGLLPPGLLRKAVLAEFVK